MLTKSALRTNRYIDYSVVIGHSLAYAVLPPPYDTAVTAFSMSNLLFYNDNGDKTVAHTGQGHPVKIAGYGDLVDNAWRMGVNAINSHMASEKFKFSSGGNDFVIWIWQGDYIWYGAGAELGIYMNESKTPFLGNDHYGPVPDRLHMNMTLNLYDYQSKDNITNYFCWAPEEEQWWATGFIPEPNWLFNLDNRPDARKMVTLGKMDFSKSEEHRDMYEDLKESFKLGSINEEKKDYVIFEDDDHIMWITWWGHEVKV